MFIHGDSLESFLVAIVIPDVEVLLEWAATQVELANLSFAELCSHPQVKQLLSDEIHHQAHLAHLLGFETPKAIYVSHQLFSVENDTLTPTFKLKRDAARNLYKSQIAQLYQEASHPSSKL